MAQRGGKRPGAGRKRDPLKDIHIAASTARKALARIDAENKIVEIFETCGDARLKTHIIFRLRESAYGKPVQAIEGGEKPIQHEHKIGNLEDVNLRITQLIQRATGKP